MKGERERECFSEGKVDAVARNEAGFQMTVIADVNCTREGSKTRIRENKQVITSPSSCYRAFSVVPIAASLGCYFSLVNGPANF